VIPKAKTALQDLAGKLMIGIAAETKTTYAASSVGMIGMLLQCLAKELERGVDTRVCDIEETRVLLTNATSNLPQRLAIEVDRFLQTKPASLLLSDVTALHARALELVTRLHEHAEAAGNESLNREIWSLLERMADRHALDF